MKFKREREGFFLDLTKDGKPEMFYDRRFEPPLEFNNDLEIVILKHPYGSEATELERVKIPGNFKLTWIKVEGKPIIL